MFSKSRADYIFSRRAKFWILLLFTWSEEFHQPQTAISECSNKKKWHTHFNPPNLTVSHVSNIIRFNQIELTPWMIFKNHLCMFLFGTHLECAQGLFLALYFGGIPSYIWRTMTCCGLNPGLLHAKREHCLVNFFVCFFVVFFFLVHTKDFYSYRSEMRLKGHPDTGGGRRLVGHQCFLQRLWLELLKRIFAFSGSVSELFITNHFLDSFMKHPYANWIYLVWNISGFGWNRKFSSSPFKKPWVVRTGVIG